MNVFQFEDYREFLRVEANSRPKERGYKASLAAAAGCQRSVFSQVLKEKMHLSRDHVAELAQFLAMSPDEREYLVLLLDLARCHSKQLKTMTIRRLEELKSRQIRRPSKLSEAEIHEPAQQTLYYSSWYWSAVHLLTSIPAYQNPAAMAKRLELPALIVQDTLASLRKMGLVDQVNGKWRPTKKSIHLPIGSPLNEVNHSHWRLRAIQDVQRRSEHSTHYSLVCSMSKAESQKLRELLMDHIMKERAVIEPSQEEELYCITHDFFQV